MKRARENAVSEFQNAWIEDRKKRILKGNDGVLRITWIMVYELVVYVFNHSWEFFCSIQNLILLMQRLRLGMQYRVVCSLFLTSLQLCLYFYALHWGRASFSCLWRLLCKTERHCFFHRLLQIRKRERKRSLSEQLYTACMCFSVCLTYYICVCQCQHMESINDQEVYCTNNIFLHNFTWHDVGELWS